MSSRSRSRRARARTPSSRRLVDDWLGVRVEHEAFGDLEHEPLGRDPMMAEQLLDFVYQLGSELDGGDVCADVDLLGPAGELFAHGA